MPVNVASFNRIGHCKRNKHELPMASAISQPSFEPVQKNAEPPRKMVSAMTAARMGGRSRLVRLNAKTSDTGSNSRIRPASALG